MTQPEPILLYLGFDDVVRCVFCQKYTRDWEIQDIPMLEHQTLHPECPFVRGFYVGNIPETQSTLEQVVLPTQPTLEQVVLPTQPTLERGVMPETGTYIDQSIGILDFWYLPLV